MMKDDLDNAAYIILMLALCIFALALLFGFFIHLIKL